MTYQPAFFARDGSVKHEADKPPLQRRMEADARRLREANRKDRERYKELTSGIAEWPQLVAQAKAMTTRNGLDFLAWFREQTWLAKHGQHVMYFALRIIDKHCNRARVELGLDPLDDPVEGDTVFFASQRVLREWGYR